MWIFLNGRYVDENEALISVKDRGFVFGDGIFEVLRTKRGKFLLPLEHLDRMMTSAAFFELRVPFTKAEIVAIAEDLIARNAIDDGEVYIQLTRGTDRHRDHRYAPDTKPTFHMLAFPVRSIDPDNWVKGARVITYPDERHALCEHKTINLLVNMRAKNAARDAQAYEAMMYRDYDGVRCVTEGGSSSYLCVRGGKLYTPEVDNILPGITRRKVIELARGQGWDVEEAHVAVEDFLTADEVILVSTVSEVMPIRQIDETTFPAPGPITKQLMEAFAEILRRELG